MNADQFLECHGSKQFRHSEELFRLISEGYPMRSASHGNTPCHHLLGIYQRRLKHLGQFAGDHAASLREDYSLLCEELSRNPEEPVRLWLLEASPLLFSVFESESDHRILGCVRGMDRTELNDADWHTLWHPPQS